ncbi:unnamed protein product [Kuraishia capsulata CBS 1993]|uniref:Uncharacterized protein n=1 Tax=Kuraishia capsulata CBS 1993 TaxID=1382522 RepID=W6MV90_9ASCO|nr:uncharacterized protein KUCA_T00005826001 [Kuraishia capsulata CBS 1993]CDK29832.1 unnamed protein product [Kuraishia capsulata CBS 1993]
MSFVKETRKRLDLHRSFDVEDDFEFCPVNDENLKMYYYSKQQQQHHQHHAQQHQQHDPVQLYKILANASANSNNASTLSPNRSPQYSDVNLKRTPWLQQQQNGSPLNSRDSYLSPSPKTNGINYLSSTPGSASSAKQITPMQFKYSQPQQYPVVNSLQAKLNMASRR